MLQLREEMYGCVFGKMREGGELAGRQDVSTCVQVDPVLEQDPAIDSCTSGKDAKSTL